MKKFNLFLFLFSLCCVYQASAQTAATPDFFAGKWEIAINGTPNGDVKFLTDLVRKDGKLTGELMNANDTTAAKRPITKIEESADRIAIYFETAEVGELSIDLAKVDDDNLKGMVYNFEATGKRVK
ncbi:hypothetical protein [Dyadobacter sp. Leaf189]|uniref:hypothetical protein n=1 Tax=Dyadobacter sp. Leaf189 TaxID=1736295 RepID=UPI0006F54A67|nr:hypothetical protein [Dyadobacter sp. Leaf189]KQS27127.1 hypothetical protein ASG33_18740 [Dyadobacter sp. Leaf189]